MKAKPLSSDFPSPYRSVKCKDELQSIEFEGCNTMDKMWDRSVKLFTEFNSNLGMGSRSVISVDEEVQPNGRVFEKLNMGDYEWLNYEEVNELVLEIGTGLLKMNHSAKARLVIFSETRQEWLITALAALKYNFPVVTVYATLGEDAIIHAINESQAETIFTTQELVQKTVNTLSKCSRLKRIFYFESRLPDAQPVGPSTLKGLPEGFPVIGFTELSDVGAEGQLLEPPQPTTPDDIALIMYTSGTTGPPKGVMISHRNFVAANCGHCNAIPSVGPQDVYIAYLPLAHVLELCAEIAALAHGVGIGYSTPLTLTDNGSKVKKGAKGDATTLRPTIMATVPIIMDRLYKTVLDKVEHSPPLMRALFEFLYELKRSKIEDGYDTPFLNRLVFSHIRGVLGGRLRLMLSGGAPLNPETQRFMNICFCCPVAQGYGLTETCGAGTVCDVEDLKTGTVGPPLPCNDIMLREWKEGGYTYKGKSPQGEVLVSGANITLGYLDNPKKTAEDYIEINGRLWFCTGDIGEFTSDGCLKIIDRKKDLIKLQHGEYVSLSRVESTLATCPLVDNIWVHGNSLRNYVVAIIVPNRKNIDALNQKLNLDTLPFDDLRIHPIVCKHVLKEIQDHAASNKLPKADVPHKIYLCKEVWTMDNGLLTEALKLKRRPLEEFYADVLKELYNEA
uniref:long-chain-fatty-acid--CoA ligase n=1 Tax=Romanomermis culicivorax TaxID=13658 RepID=A0A915JQK6_ROMCU